MHHRLSYQRESHRSNPRQVGQAWYLINLDGNASHEAATEKAREAGLP